MSTEIKSAAVFIPLSSSQSMSAHKAKLYLETGMINNSSDLFGLDSNGVAIARKFLSRSDQCFTFSNYIGFHLDFISEYPGILIYDEESFDSDLACCFIRTVLEVFDLPLNVPLSVSIASKPMTPDGFGGEAHLISKHGVFTNTTNNWLSQSSILKEAS